MIRTAKVYFRTAKTDLNRLFDCNRTSAMVWNDSLNIARAHHQITGKWITKTELQKATKGKYPIHSQSIQAVCHKYLWARDNAKKARDKGYKVRYPWRNKKNYPTKWVKDGLTVHSNGKIKLSMGNWEGKRQKPIVVYVKSLPQGCIKEIELIWDRKLMLAISYDDGIKPQNNTNTSVASIDLGEIHSIASVSETGEALIITARKLRSIKRLRNKKYKELQKKRSLCKKGSRRWRKLTRAMSRIGSKTEAQQRDILHKTSKSFVNWSVKNNIKTVVVGDIEGVQRNTSSKKKKNHSKKRRSRQTNQKLSQWSFGILLNYLNYKLETVGIELIKIDESYTSQTCPVCNRRKKVTGRIYHCYCGYKEHRDLHGAKNILAKYKHGEIKDLGVPINGVTYLRPVA